MGGWGGRERGGGRSVQRGDSTNLFKEWKREGEKRKGVGGGGQREVCFKNGGKD